MLAACSGAEPAQGEDTSTASEAVKSTVKDGEHKFDHKLATGNGRACATCHVEADHFTLTPAHVTARYNALPRHHGQVDYSADPLFNSIDADDFNRSFTNLRAGRIRITLALPANVSLAENPSARTVSVWRGVPTIENVAFTAPFLQDGRAASLEEQALGAAIAHQQPKKNPDADFLSAVAAYERDQFSSPRTRALSHEIAAGTATHPAIPTDLTAQEAAGMDSFHTRCGSCHGSPSLDQGPFPTGDMHFKNVGVSVFNFAQLPVHTFVIKNPDNSTTQMTSPDPGRFLITGAMQDFNAFDTNTVYGIKNTAPYFHDNSAPDLMSVMFHYQAEFARIRSFGAPYDTYPPVQPMSDTEMAAIVAFMSRL
ncbi:MAG: hypothetical protein JWM74_1623 [Myxococcaceae bacterium]|nr:hypothetical protein [Myxococcaceae bacterium]